MFTAADAEYIRVLELIHQEFPKFRIVSKADFWYMHAIDYVLRVVTLDRMLGFMTRYTTTIGYTVYLGSSWPDLPAIQQSSVLRHEAVHMRQRNRMGALRFSLVYLFWPFPIFFAKGRRDLEMEAYRETLKAYFEYYGEFIAIDEGVRIRIIGEFVGSSYFWMWPFRKTIERWYDGVITELLVESRKKLDGQQA